MTNVAQQGKLNVGNPHVWFEEGEIAPAATPRRGSLLCKLLVACLIVALSGHVFSTEVDRGDRAIISNGTVESLRFDGEAIGAVKSGLQDAAVQLSGVKGKGTLSFCVVNGGASFSGNVSSEETVPSVLAEQAALWLKSDVNVDCASGSSVTTWYDCRETNAGGFYGQQRFRASSREGSGGAPSTVWPQQSADGIDFGSYGSGAWMRFQNESGGDANIENVYYAFIVYNVSTATDLGYYFGAASGGTAYFHRSEIGSYISEYSSPLKARAGQFRVDGERIDPIGSSVKTDTHVLSYEAGGAAAVRIDGLFCDRDINDKQRCGGGIAAEVILFTNRLQAAERLSVEHYLAAKYNVADDRQFVPLVNVQPSGDGHVDVSSSIAQSYSPTNGVTIGGAGRIEVANGALTLSSRNAEEFEGSVRYASAGTFTGGPVPYGAEAGKSVDLTADDHGVVAVTPSAAPAGSFVKTGGADLCLREIPSDITSLEFSGGTLHLLGRRLPCRPAVAVFANPGFELNNAPAGDLKITSPTDTPIADEIPGWTIQINSGDNSPAFWHFTKAAMPARSWFSPHPPPEGNYALGFKVSGDIWTSVGVAEPGVYELTFKTCARDGYGGARIAVSIDGNVFACLTTMTGSGFVLHRLRTPLLAAGDRVLRLSCTTTFDTTVIYDDFKMVKIADGVGSDGVWPLPNGDFEDVTYANQSNVKKANGGVVSGWTIPEASSSQATYVVSRQDENSRYCEANSAGGNQQLVLFGEGAGVEGQAFSAADLGIPPGRYQLRAKAARWGGNGAWLDGVEWDGRWSQPKLVGTIAVNGTVFDCGSASVEQSYFGSVTLPQSVDIPSGATVKVSISNLRGDGNKSGLAVDDVELVSTEAIEEAAAKTKEYVANGGFETGDYSSAWTKIGTGEVRDTTTSTTHNVPYPYVSGYGNRYVFRILQSCLISQNIVFDRAGVYRLKFAANGRNAVNYSGNALRAWLVASGSTATNVLCETAPIYTHEFAQFEYLFQIDEPGTYKFGIQGMNGLDGIQVGKRADDATCHVDNISIRYVGEAALGIENRGPDIVLSADSSLRLDFTGTPRVHSLRIGTRRFHGVVDSSSDARISGPGALIVESNGLSLIFR